MGEAAEINWAEKRNALRARTFKKGRIVIKGMSTMDCVIRNMSLTGARLAVPNATALPDEFELIIGDEGLRRECEVKSRTETSAGVRFFKNLTPRELGGEFMSARGVIEKAPETFVQDAAAPVAPTGLVKLRPRSLPAAMVQHFPW